jgi:hypothetical protein
MEAGSLEIFHTLYDILKDRPDLFIAAILLVSWLLERSERKQQIEKNDELIGKMHDQNKDTAELLGQIKFLLELLTKGRK